MIEKEFCTDDLPAASRFSYLRDSMSQAPAPLEASSDDTADLRYYQRDIHIDTMRVWTMDFQPMTFRRTGRLIRRSDPETYNICLLQQGAMTLDLGKRKAAYGPSDLHTHDSSRPFELRARSARGQVSCIGIEIPKLLVPLSGRQADKVIGQVVSGDKGIGALLAQFLSRLSTDTNSYRPVDGHHLGVVAADLVSALFAHIVADDGLFLSPETHQHTLVRRIQAFIQQHLGDPALGPATVAAAHHISLRTLHRLFEAQDTTVAAWIRARRLDRCHRDLSDPGIGDQPIHAIASRWGFPDASHFTRAFRTAYGLSPRDYRRRHRSHARRDGPASASPRRGRRDRR